MLLFLFAVLQVASKADIADDQTIVSINRSSLRRPSPSLRAMSISSFVDVRSIPDMLAGHLGTRRRLTSSETTVADCLSNELAVESMFTVGVQVIDTASVNCRATRQEVCRYLEDAAEALEMDAICEPNYVVKLEEIVPEAEESAPEPRDNLSMDLLGVNDKYAWWQANLRRIGMKEAWEALEGHNTIQVNVAVIGTGVDFDHVDLAYNILTDEDGYLVGYNAFDPDSPPYDFDGHGTHCAGILGAETDNEIGIAGIAPVRIMPIRMSSDAGQSNTAILIRALNYAVANNAIISTHSYGHPGPSQAFKTAMQNAANQGHLIIAAAGNNGALLDANTSDPCHFAADVDMLCVASSSPNDELSSFSNYAPFVRIAAPGEGILSTTPLNRYTTRSGTSMAAPHVAGVAALLYSLGLTQSQVIDILESSADPLKNSQGRSFPPAGRLNAKKAVEAGLALC